MANQHFLVTNQIAANCWDRDKVELFVPCISKSKLHRRRPQTVRRIKPRPSERQPGQHTIEKVDTSKKDKGNELRQDGRQAGASQVEDKMEDRGDKTGETRPETSPGRRTQHPRPARRRDEAGRQDLVVSSCRHASFDFWSDLLDSWITSVVFPLVDACLDYILRIMFEIAASFSVQTQVPSSHCKPHHVLMQQLFLLLYTSPCSPACPPARGTAPEIRNRSRNSIILPRNNATTSWLVPKKFPLRFFYFWAGLFSYYTSFSDVMCCELVGHPVYIVL